jgi:hypothetical protein
MKAHIEFRRLAAHFLRWRRLTSRLIVYLTAGKESVPALISRLPFTECTALTIRWFDFIVFSYDCFPTKDAVWSSETLFLKRTLWKIHSLSDVALRIWYFSVSSMPVSARVDSIKQLLHTGWVLTECWQLQDSWTQFSRGLAGLLNGHVFRMRSSLAVIRMSS